MLSAMLPAEPGDGQVEELDRRLENDARKQRQRRLDRPAQRDRAREIAELGDDERDHHPGEIGGAQLVVDRAEADLRQLRDQEIGREGDQRREEEVPRPNPAYGCELRKLRVRRGSRGDAKLLERDLVRTGEVARVRRQRRALQVRQSPGDRVVAGSAARGVERAFVPDEHRAGHEQLGHVDVDRRLRSAESCGRQIRRAPAYRRRLRRSGAFSRPCEMPAAWSRATSCHSSWSRWIRHLLRRHVLERLDVGLTRDDQRVAPQPLRPR